MSLLLSLEKWFGKTGICTGDSTACQGLLPLLCLPLAYNCGKREENRVSNFPESDKRPVESPLAGSFCLPMGID
jgi:hypothetical protein